MITFPKSLLTYIYTLRNDYISFLNRYIYTLRNDYISFLNHYAYIH